MSYKSRGGVLIQFAGYDKEIAVESVTTYRPVGRADGVHMLKIELLDAPRWVGCLLKLFLWAYARREP